MRSCSKLIDKNQVLLRHNILHLPFLLVLMGLESRQSLSNLNSILFDLPEGFEDFRLKAAPDKQAMLLHLKLLTANSRLCVM